MQNILNFDLKAVDLYESILINKRKIDHEKMQVLIKKSAAPLEAHKNHYAQTCTVDFFPVSEESIDILERTFSIRITVVGVFANIDPEISVDLEEFKEYAFRELFPHVRSILATTMTNAGMTPYYLPLSFCK